jgi:hypothetical protein
MNLSSSNQKLVCSNCDWTLSHKFLLNDQTRQLDLFKGTSKFNTHVYNQCSLSNINYDKMLALCKKRIKKAIHLRNSSNYTPNPSCLASDSLQRFTQTYDRIRNTVCNDYFNNKYSKCKIKQVKKDCEGPYYLEETFTYSEHFCELLDPCMEEILLLHETDPGHHYMYKALGNKLPENNVAIIEGWGLYVERYHQKNPKNIYGYNTSILVRCCRAIIDIMYHYLSSTEEECKAFLSEYYPFPLQIDREISRVKTMPGYNICYLIGEHFFVYCFNKFSSRYKNLKEYHDELLQSIQEEIETNKNYTLDSVYERFKNK